MPHFHKAEKLEKFERHWQHRLGLEALKKEHVERFPTPTEADRKQMEAELSQYIAAVNEYEDERKLDDVYVTDHTLPPKKVLAGSEEEE